ncbi:MAG TPA: hypothetical protein VFU45_06495 [Gemmatimonadales bacterium]|nr:hypothetical protein [Gemmatimonadales bacterium]
MPTEPALTPRERVLLHQIHPLKLATDWGTAVAAAYLLWQHHLGAALRVGLVPPVVVTLALLRWADLGPLGASAFGRYILRHMTRAMEALRFDGLALAWLAAWTRGAITFGERNAGANHH